MDHKPEYQIPPNSKGKEGAGRQQQPHPLLCGLFVLTIAYCGMLVLFEDLLNLVS